MTHHALSRGAAPNTSFAVDRGNEPTTYPEPDSRRGFGFGRRARRAEGTDDAGPRRERPATPYVAQHRAH